MRPSRPRRPGKPNAGFSDVRPGLLYLPQDPGPHRPTVTAQLADPRSLLHIVRRLLALRAAHPALGVGSDQQVLTHDHPFAYTRGGSHPVVVNPLRHATNGTRRYVTPDPAGAAPGPP
jgi:glycosidase